MKYILILLLSLYIVTNAYADNLNGGNLGGESAPLSFKTATSDLVYPVTVQVTNFDNLGNNIIGLNLGGGSGGSGTTNHALLTNLNWASAGHTFDTNLDIGSNSLISTGTATSDIVDVASASRFNYLTNNRLVISNGRNEIVSLAGGTSGQILTSTGINSLPTWQTASGGGNVTAGSNLTDNAIVRGDGGSTGIKTSGVTISDTDNITGVVNLTITGTATSDIVDTHYISYTSGSSVIIEDSLNVYGNITAPTFIGNLTGNVTGNCSGTSATFTGNLSGEVTSVAMTTTIADSITVTGWALGTSSATQITSPTVLIDLLDGVGAVDMDYGSADITDHTFTTDGGTVILDGSINSSTLTASEIVITDASKNLVSAAVATYPSLTELSYVKGLSSAVQTQIGGKQATVTEGSLADSVIVSADIKNGEIVVADTAITAGRSLTWSTNDLVADAELYTDFKAITIETPTDADNFFMFEAPFALTITRVHGIVESATSAVITFQECDSAGDTAVTIESITADVDGTISTSIDNAGIDAGDIVRIDVGTVTGTVGQVSGTITFTKDD